MEEDINILENYKDMNLDDFNYNERQVKQAIENLINRNKNLEKRDRANRKVIREYSDCIPKSKIREKIREKIKECERDIEVRDIYDYEKNWNKIEVLQELLEE